MGCGGSTAAGASAPEGKAAALPNDSAAPRNAVDVALQIYGLFGEGKIPEINEFMAADGRVTWMGDKGKQEFVGFNNFAECVLGRIGAEWPSFKLGMDKHEVLVNEGKKCVFKIPAATDNGMDTWFVHYMEVNDDGKVVDFMALDDGMAFSKTKLPVEQEPPAPPSVPTRTFTAAPPASGEAMKAALRVYELFGEGKIEEIVAAHIPDSKCVWMGDQGKQEFSGFSGFVADGPVSRLPTEWPSFKIDVEQREVLVDAGKKCLLKFPACTDNGMDTWFVHYYEVNDEGKVTVFYALDDGAAFAASRVAPAE